MLAQGATHIKFQIPKLETRSVPVDQDLSFPPLADRGVAPEQPEELEFGIAELRRVAYDELTIWIATATDRVWDADNRLSSVEYAVKRLIADVFRPGIGRIGASGSGAPRVLRLRAGCAGESRRLALGRS